MSNKLKAVVTADTKDFNSKMDGLGTTAVAASTVAFAAIAAIGAAVYKMGQELITSAKNYEDLGAQIKASIGDTQEADKWLKIINETASKSTENNIELGETFSALFSSSGAELAKNFENVTSRAKILKLSLVETSTQLGGLFSKLKEGKTTGLEASINSSQLRRFLGNEAATELNTMIKSGASAEKVLAKLSQTIETNGEAAKKLRAGTASGKENILMGLFDFKKAGQGGAALENYKKILDSLIEKSESGNFDKIGDAFGRLFEIILKIVNSSGFDAFLEFTVVWISRIVDAVAAVIAVFGLWLQSMKPLLDILNMINNAWDKITDGALDLIMPGSDQAAPTKEEIQAARDQKLQREANQRLVANYENGAPA